ncbi:MAG TPA: hypothetical protein DCE42_08115 [Myxococcales bacterium]|nr:hypothetical protein [Deltaproteobacteria bacterium]MBU52000.1 hypothetical protein [Deltaproteobacteria bacterium]HAA54709.1 hypothetical protein [Myxococcales bacterium]
MSFFDNPVANLPGPQFLTFYVMLGVGVAITVWILARWLDTSRSMPRMRVPRDPDPLEIAYIRGGENEIVRVLIFDLAQRGYLDFDDDLFIQDPHHPPSRHLDELEYEVFDFMRTPRTTSDIYGDNGLPEKLEPLCKEFQTFSLKEKLIYSEEAQKQANWMRLFGMGFLITLAVYKIFVAMSRGIYKIWFLVMLCFVFSWLVGAIVNIGRMTKRGKDYIDDLEEAFSRIRDRVALGEYDDGAPEMMLALSVFGVGILAGTAFDFYPGMFYLGTGLGCGGACGSCSSCSSSSCGSSCGGGCGGGCGGCGGCGG